MKKYWKYLIAAALLCGAAATVTGCSQWDPVYQHMDEDGYTVSVRFDANGGTISGKEGVSVVDVFKLSDYTPSADGKISLRILDLSDEARKKVGNYSADRVGYFLAGWYTERQPRVNEQGEALDDYGELVSISGREQGYTYSGRWDFESDRLVVDAGGTYSSFDHQMTLYAAWIPEITYEFYAEDASGAFQKLESASTEKPMVVEFPVWNETTGKQDMKNVPKREGMTFVSAFMDEQMTVPVPGSIHSTDYVDYEHGIGLQHTVSVYTTWKAGAWYRIQTPKQFFDIGDPNGCYEILADLDFADQLWPVGFTKNEFKGSIVGGGHTIRNVTVNQGDTAQDFGGLFGALGSTAVISDVTFENVTYSLQAGSRKPAPAFGVLAGNLRDGATLTNVAVSGTLEIGAECVPAADYNVGLLFGFGTTPEGMTHANVTCVLRDPDNNTTRFEVDEATGQVTLTFAD